MTPHYQAQQRGPRNWGFTTPTGSCFGTPTEAGAKRLAEVTERQDRQIAETGKGPLAAILRQHFSPKPSSRPLDLRPHKG